MRNLLFVAKSFVVITASIIFMACSKEDVAKNISPPQKLHQKNYIEVEDCVNPIECDKKFLSIINNGEKVTIERYVATVVLGEIKRIEYVDEVHPIFGENKRVWQIPGDDDRYSLSENECCINRIESDKNKANLEKLLKYNIEAREELEKSGDEIDVSDLEYLESVKKSIKYFKQRLSPEGLYLYSKVRGYDEMIKLAKARVAVQNKVPAESSQTTTAIVENLDDQDHIWTPDGIYDNKSIKAILSAKKGHGTLNAGNGCVVSGKLSQKTKGEPVYILATQESDGVDCPDVKDYTITILTGPAIRAAGNAENIKISHNPQSRSVDFSGVYVFEAEEEE